MASGIPIETLKDQTLVSHNNTVPNILAKVTSLKEHEDEQQQQQRIKSMLMEISFHFPSCSERKKSLFLALNWLYVYN